MDVSEGLEDQSDADNTKDGRKDLGHCWEEVFRNGAGKNGESVKVSRNHDTAGFTAVKTTYCIAPVR